MDETGRIGEISMMENKFSIPDVGILIQMIYSIGVKKRGAPFNAVHFISFFKKEFGKICAVLSGDPGDQCFLGHFLVIFLWYVGFRQIF